jgi:hypothetical protein
VYKSLWAHVQMYWHLLMMALGGLVFFRWADGWLIIPVIDRHNRITFATSPGSTFIVVIWMIVEWLLGDRKMLAYEETII